jgi:hypothetical protein
MAFFKNYEVIMEDFVDNLNLHINISNYDKQAIGIHCKLV